MFIELLFKHLDWVWLSLESFCSRFGWDLFRCHYLRWSLRIVKLLKELAHLLPLLAKIWWFEGVYTTLWNSVPLELENYRRPFLYLVAKWFFFLSKRGLFMDSCCKRCNYLHIYFCKIAFSLLFREQWHTLILIFRVSYCLESTQELFVFLFELTIFLHQFKDLLFIVCLILWVLDIFLFKFFIYLA